ncbi:sulfotransferase domain-containing protein [Coleofasciculus sp. G1-WW12-02]|uniref:sulfotransferase domain-containing protein n=1 Tax=unclassified Coleofasciculus TaxID=2692782 RepID=UPI003304C3BE
MKPNYMVIGAGKCATTTLCTLLGHHPDVFMVKCKEPNFFSHDPIYARGFDWYESLYNEVGSKRMRGEGSNCYTAKERYPHTLSRLVAYAPDLKLIYIVRDPIARIESLWLQKRSHGGEEVHYDFNTAVRINRDSLVDTSNYWQQIDAYRTHFPDERIHIIFYEDFQADTEAVMRRCFQFLDVDPDAPLADPQLHLNPSTGKKVPSHTLSRLRSFSLFRATAKLIPPSLRHRLKQQLFFQEFSGRPQWQPQTREWVADILEADTSRFLEYCNQPQDLWQLRG